MQMGKIKLIFIQSFDGSGFDFRNIDGIDNYETKITHVENNKARHSEEGL